MQIKELSGVAAFQAVVQSVSILRVHNSNPITLAEVKREKDDPCFKFKVISITSVQLARTITWPKNNCKEGWERMTFFLSDQKEKNEMRFRESAKILNKTLANQVQQHIKG